MLVRMGLLVSGISLLASCGDGAAGDFEAVLDPGFTGGAFGADRDCLEITSTTGEPVTVERVAFEPTTASTAAQEWTGVTVDADGERFCVDVCACGGGVVGRFVVEQGGAEQTFDVSWEDERCCEGPGLPGSDAGF